MNEYFHVRGMDDIKAAFKDLPLNLQRKALRPAMREAVNLAAMAVRVSAPKGATGALKRGIVAEVAASRSQGMRGKVLIKHGRNKAGKLMKFDPYYWKWVEKGHRIRSKRGGKVFGQVPAHPFIAPAWDGVKDRVYSVLYRRLEAELESRGHFK